MKTFLVLVIVLAMWSPGLWFAGHLTDLYGSEGNAPFMAFVVEIVLLLLPIYFAFGPGHKHLESLLKFLGIVDDD